MVVFGLFVVVEFGCLFVVWLFGGCARVLGVVCGVFGFGLFVVVGGVVVGVLIVLFSFRLFYMCLFVVASGWFNDGCWWFYWFWFVLFMNLVNAFYVSFDGFGLWWCFVYLFGLCGCLLMLCGLFVVRYFVFGWCCLVCWVGLYCCVLLVVVYFV